MAGTLVLSPRSHNPFEKSQLQIGALHTRTCQPPRYSASRLRHAAPELHDRVHEARQRLGLLPHEALEGGHFFFYKSKAFLS